MNGAKRSGRTDAATSAPPRRTEKRTQVERRAQAEARLLECARTLVARRGAAGMTLATAGEMAGYSRGLAAHHFGNKAALLRSLAEYIGNHFMTLFDDAKLETTGFAAVLHFIQTYLGRSGAEWTNTRAQLAMMADGITDDTMVGAELAKYNDVVISLLSKHFAEGIVQGEIRSEIDVRSSAICLLGALRGVMLQVLLKESQIDLASVRRQLLISTIHSYAVSPETWLAIARSR